MQSSSIFKRYRGRTNFRRMPARAKHWFRPEIECTEIVGGRGLASGTFRRPWGSSLKMDCHGYIVFRNAWPSTAGVLEVLRFPHHESLVTVKTICPHERWHESIIMARCTYLSLWLFHEPKNCPISSPRRIYLFISTDLWTLGTQ